MGHYFICEVEWVRRTSAMGVVDGMTHIVSAPVPVLGVVMLVLMLCHPS